jgi:hypothetical protein
MRIKNVSDAEVRALLQNRGMRELGLAATRRRQNPIVSNTLELINQPMYDSYSVAANTAVVKTVLFQSPIGQSSKTLAQTNMTKAGQLEFPQKLEIHRIGVWISNNTTPTDLFNLLQNLSFTFTVGKKPMLEVPLGFLPAACGAQVTAAAFNTTTAGTSAPVFATSNGSVDSRAGFTLDYPVVIDSGEGFSVTINPETAYTTQASTTNPAGVGYTLYVTLDGILYRGVQ